MWREEEGSEREDCARIVCPECTVAMRMAGGRVKVERMEGWWEGGRDGGGGSQ